MELKPITSISQVKDVIHGTYLKHWNFIKSQGLSRMNRTHIHFANGLPTDSNVISGMRKDCEIYIFIDLKKGLEDNVKFFQSSNGVILCSGNERGFLEPKYFLKVINAKSKEILL